MDDERFQYRVDGYQSSGPMNLDACVEIARRISRRPVRVFLMCWLWDHSCWGYAAYFHEGFWWPLDEYARAFPLDDLAPQWRGRRNDVAEEPTGEGRAEDGV